MNPDAPAPRRNFVVLYWRKIGGGSLMLSVVLHAALLLAAGYLVTKVVQEEQAVDFMPAGATKQSAQATEELHRKLDVRRTETSSAIHRGHILTASLEPVLKLPEDPFENVPSPQMDDLLRRLTESTGAHDHGHSFITPDASPAGGPGHSPGPMPFIPPQLIKRCGTAERLQSLKQNGGSAQCERAVSTALEWSRTQQNGDGSWGRAHKAAMTGFALLCYLGRCETLDSPFYGDNVMKGILYLVELAKKNPHGVFAEDAEAHAATYEHGIATYALGEMYAFARLGTRQLPGLREAFERGVKVIVENQGHDGGWRYSQEGFCYDANYTGKGDLSVTGWQYQALKAAKLTGLKLDGLHPTIDRTVDYLKAMQNSKTDGGFGNTNREQGYNQWNLTGVGVLGLQTLGKGGYKTEIKRGVKFAQDFITKEPPDWNANCNLYAWYYLSQAFFQNGGEGWKEWNDAVLPQLLTNQNTDGSWKTETSDSSIASTTPAGVDRTLYRTALCTLMLEVYYRYLKVGDREQESVFQR